MADLDAPTPRTPEDTGPLEHPSDREVLTKVLMDAGYAVSGAMLALLGAAGAPEAVGVTPRAAVVVGACSVAVLAVARMLALRGRPAAVDWVALALGLVLAVLAVFGIVVPFTADQIVAAGGTIAAVLASIRSRA